MVQKSNRTPLEYKEYTIKKLPHEQQPPIDEGSFSQSLSQNIQRIQDIDDQVEREIQKETIKKQV